MQQPDWLHMAAKQEDGERVVTAATACPHRVAEKLFKDTGLLSSPYAFTRKWQNPYFYIRTVSLLRTIRLLDYFAV